MRTQIVPLLPTLALALFVGGSVAGQTPEVVAQVERDLAAKRLQGTWVPDVLVTAEGAEAYPLAGRSLGFDGGRFARHEGRRCVALGTFEIDGGVLRLTVAEARPWDPEAAPGRERAEYAFRVEGDRLTLCHATTGGVKAGDLSPGAGRLVVVYKRQPDKR